MRKVKHVLRWALVGLTLSGLWQGSIAALAAGKAWLAPILVERAWAAGVEGPVHPPWPWADGRPAGLIEAPRQNVVRHVLSDASMRMLAFGPVAVNTQAGQVYFGHNDTHFAFLRHLRKNDTLFITREDRIKRPYRIADFQVMEEDAIRVPLQEGNGNDRVVLVTCYPFDALITNSSQRYVVTALAMPE